MEFFSRDLSEGETRKRRSGYLRYIEELDLPARLGDLALRDLQDGRLHRIVVDRRTQQVILFLRLYGPENGGRTNGNGHARGPDDPCPDTPRDVEILYHRVDLERLDAELLEARAADPETCILAGEMDRGDDGRFVHRLLFEPEGELEVTFRDAAYVERTPP